jgi:hypothetical protein
MSRVDWNPDSRTLPSLAFLPCPAQDNLVVAEHGNNRE